MWIRACICSIKAARSGSIAARRLEMNDFGFTDVRGRQATSAVVHMAPLEFPRWQCHVLPNTVVSLLKLAHTNGTIRRGPSSVVDNANSNRILGGYGNRAGLSRQQLAPGRDGVEFAKNKRVSGSPPKGLN